MTGMVARFDREILIFVLCEFCIFHFANVYHTVEQSVVASAATNINTQPTSFVIQGKSTACTAHNAVGASATQNWETARIAQIGNAAEAPFFGENSQIEFLAKLRSSCCSNCTKISLKQFKSNC